jgi:hypothetical protein
MTRDALDGSGRRCIQRAPRAPPAGRGAAAVPSPGPFFGASQGVQEAAAPEFMLYKIFTIAS